MKKILISILAVGAFALAVPSVAGAQGIQPPTNAGGFGPMMVTGQTGPMHSYMVAALADALDLSTNDVEARLAAGETGYQIALAQGIRTEDIPALMLEVRTQAVNAAVADGVLTQAQANRMLQHGFSRGGAGQGMMGTGTGPCGGTGVPIGSGMRRGRTSVISP